jgi:hypothetical protein
MIEAGTYKGRGIEAALGKAQTGTFQVAVLLQLMTVDGEKAGHLTWHGSFTDQTTDRTIESLRTLGWEGDDLSDLRGIDRNDVEVVVEHEVGNDGKTRPRAKWINRPATLALKNRLAPADAKVFAQKMKGHVVAQRQKSGASASSQPSRSTSSDSAPMPDDRDLF